MVSGGDRTSSPPPLLSLFEGNFSNRGMPLHRVRFSQQAIAPEGSKPSARPRGGERFNAQRGHHMKRLAITLAMLAAVASAGAQTTFNRVGNTTYMNSFSSGTSATINRSGGTSYYSDSNGVTGTSRQIGDTRYSNFSDGRQRLRAGLATQPS